MSLSYRGPQGTIEYRWIAYALLRDNVVHHLEDDASGARFPELHGVGEALSGEPVALDAVALREELQRASALLPRPLADLAVSRRTRAILSYALPADDAARETELASACGFRPRAVVPNAETLDDAFGYLLRGLLRITEGAQPGDKVEVVDL